MFNPQGEPVDALTAIHRVPMQEDLQPGIDSESAIPLAAYGQSLLQFCNLLCLPTLFYVDTSFTIDDQQETARFIERLLWISA